MDNNVVWLDERRHGKKPQLATNLRSVYYCLACESESFRLFSEGMIQCNRCGKQIHKLQVVVK